MPTYKFRKGNWHGNIVPNTKEMHGGFYTHKILWIFQIGADVYKNPRKGGPDPKTGPLRDIPPANFVYEDEISPKSCPWEYGEFILPEVLRTHF